MLDQQTTHKHRTAKGERRLQGLMAVATDLFLERGFAAVTVDDLIAQVGGSRRIVYGHFGGKEGLFIEVVTRQCEALARPLMMLNIDDHEPREAFISFGRQLLQTVLQPRTLELHRLMIAEGKRFPELAQSILKAGHLNAITILAVWIEAYRSKSQCKLGANLPAVMLAQQFVDMVVSQSQLRALVGFDSQAQSSTNIDLIVNNAVDTFLHGTLSRKASNEFN